METAGPRQGNLARVLGLVHAHGPLSRATLTEITGLNRSTIADLVFDLASSGLVEERAPGPVGRVGRPSPMVAASPHVVAITANPEVDALEIAAVALDRHILVRERIAYDAPPSPDEVVRLIAETIARWSGDDLVDARIAAIGLAVPGLVRASDGLVRNAPHLGWSEAPLGTLVEAATGIPTVIGNDASLGALAEHRYGAAAGVSDAVYLNGGASGIGGGVIVHGLPLGGAGGYAGEFGQNRPGIATAADRLADDGVLEDEVSRARLVAAVARGPLDDHALATALASASTDAAEEAARQRRILATALANAVNVLNPAVVVLGGFLAGLAEVDIPGLEADVRAQAMAANGEDLRILTAALADDRLLIGAAEVAFAPLLRDPGAGIVTPG